MSHRNPGALLGRNAAPSITDVELDCGGIASSTERQRSTPGYGLHGVMHQIEQGTPEDILVQGYRAERNEACGRQGNWRVPSPNGEAQAGQ